MEKFQTSPIINFFRTAFTKKRESSYQLGGKTILSLVYNFKYIRFCSCYNANIARCEHRVLAKQKHMVRYIQLRKTFL